MSDEEELNRGPRTGQRGRQELRAVRTPRIIRFPTSTVLVEPRTLRERIREAVRALFRPRKPNVGKATVFRVNNPAQWKLERARRKARGNL